MTSNVCPACGQWEVTKRVEPADGARAWAICSACGTRIPFLRLPLLWVTGASGAGKSTLARLLPPLLPEAIVLDSDILWGAIPATPEDDYRSYTDVWLRLAKNIHQAGRPVVLCGTVTPERLDACDERRYFAAMHILALTCSPDVLRTRLRDRPEWRTSHDEAFIAEMVRFNAWLREHAMTTVPPMTVLDSTALDPDETARGAAAWVHSHLNERG